MRIYTVQFDHKPPIEVPASPAGLINFVAKTPEALCEDSCFIRVSLQGMTQGMVINFIALATKANHHLQFIFSGSVVGAQRRFQFWRRYWRNEIDLRYGSGMTFEAVVNDFLSRSGLSRFVTQTADGLQFTGKFKSVKSAAAAIGRVENMLRWCERWTSQLKLQSEALLSWESFDKISVYGEQPIVSRSHLVNRPQPIKPTHPVEGQVTT